jgi:hypothetical protein
VLLEIPYDRKYAECYARGGRLVEDFPELRDALCGLVAEDSRIRAAQIGTGREAKGDG